MLDRFDGFTWQRANVVTNSPPAERLAPAEQLPEPRSRTATASGRWVRASSVKALSSSAS